MFGAAFLQTCTPNASGNFVYKYTAPPRILKRECPCRWSQCSGPWCSRLVTCRGASQDDEAKAAIDRHTQPRWSRNR
eukprot:6578826-Prymnesium_polylepis.2